MSLIQKKRGSDLPQTPVGFDTDELFLIGYRMDTGESVKFPMMNYSKQIDEENALTIGYETFDQEHGGPNHDGAYPSGTVVYHEAGLKRFIADHEANTPWDDSEVEDYNLEMEHQELRDAISANAAAIAFLNENAAMKNGFYEDLTAGNAVNILSEDVVTEQTTLDITAPNNEIGNGSARMQTIEGDGVAWSQLYDKKAGGSSVATEHGQLEFLYGKVVERFTTEAGTTPMGCLFLREFLTGADLTGRVAVTGEGFVPAVTEENQSNYTGLHYKVRATHAEAVQRSGEEGSYTYSSAFFVGGANFSASAKRNVIDMALAFGIEGNSDSGYYIPTSAPSTLAAMYGWLGSKVGLRDDYDYNGGELIGVKVLQLRSMPGVNLLDPTSGVALCPYYEWENADGLYRIAASVEGAEVGRT